MAMELMITASCQGSLSQIAERPTEPKIGWMASKIGWLEVLFPQAPKL